MKSHRIRTYTDDFKEIPFCCVCGQEYPEGECPGDFVAKETQSVDNKKEDKNNMTGG